ncbi:hypothetical protein AB0I84_23295 [Streptomyces spectabilis]|uniref:hypothetical protein n=1 Tax=Streptomyces spectabilis TaxID=68270 RepID=UPI0033CAE76A
MSGWFARGAGLRQAVSAQRAGQQQAQALLDSVQQTLNEQRRQIALDIKRRVHAQLLTACASRASAHDASHYVASRQLPPPLLQDPGNPEYDRQRQAQIEIGADDQLRTEQARHDATRDAEMAVAHAMAMVRLETPSVVEEALALVRAARQHSIDPYVEARTAYLAAATEDLRRS